MRYLLAEEMLAIHDRIVSEIGGVKGIRDVGLLHSIAERPKMTMMGRVFYPDIYTKAAAYMEALTTYHVFTDGNKRTAIVSTSHFLRANGFWLEMTTDAAYQFVMAVATKKKSIEEIAKWLKKYSKKIT